MTEEEREAARYVPTGVTRYDGNPFIEALPKYPASSDELLTCTANYPQPPSASIRRAGEMIRLAELRILSTLRLALPEYHRASKALTIAIREPYVTRNPLSLTDVRRRHEIVMAQDASQFDAGLRLQESCAMGYTIIAQTGMGKTSYMLSFLRNYQERIRHKSYNGRQLICTQIPFLVLGCPHDGTLKSLCLQFFAKIDGILGTKYLKQAFAVRSIAPMVMLMAVVAIDVSLGLIVIDDLQNLRAAKGSTAEQMLSLLTDIVEKVGVSLLILATPAVQEVLESSVRNIRKITTCGDLIVRPVHSKSKLWREYTDVYWEYAFTKKHGPLTPEIRNAWHRASGGNYGLAALAFYLAQNEVIGETEVVDDATFRRVASKQMALLQPAISALLSGNPDEQLKFDDLVLGKSYQKLMNPLAGPVAKAKTYNHVKFDDEETESPKSKTRRTRVAGQARGIPTKRIQVDMQTSVPRENPLRN